MNLYMQAVAGTECFLGKNSPMRASEIILASKYSLVLRKIFFVRKKSRLLHIPLNKKTIDDGLIIKAFIQAFKTLTYCSLQRKSEHKDSHCIQDQAVSDTHRIFSWKKKSLWNNPELIHRGQKWHLEHNASDGAELVPNARGEGAKDTQPMYVAEYSLPPDSSEQCSFTVFCVKQHTHTLLPKWRPVYLRVVNNYLVSRCINIFFCFLNSL